MEALTFQTEALRIEKLMYRICWAYLKHDADCADAVQETLIRAWEKRNTLRKPELFRPWILRILTNQCKDMLRKRRKQSFYPLEENTVIVPPPSDPSPVMEAIERLRPELRLIVVLHYSDGYSVAEISQLLHCPIGTVKSRLRIARKNLSKTLEVKWEESL